MKNITHLTTKLRTATLSLVVSTSLICSIVLHPAISAETDVLRPRIGLALGGGGTRGAAHVGVLRVLKEEGIQIDAIAGTSMGSIVGGLYCGGMNIDDIERLFYNRKLLGAFNTVPIPVRIALIPIFFIPHLFGYHPYDGLYRGNKFAHFLASLVPDDKQEIENYQPVFWAIATNLLDGEPFAIKSGNIGRALQASSAIPQLRRPVEMQGGLFVDGGMVENLPVEHSLQMNCDYVIAVDVDERMSAVPPETFRAIGSVSKRVININLAHIDRPQQKLANIVIHPDVGEIGLLSQNTKDARRAVIAGEEATRQAIGQIKEQLEVIRRKKAAEQLAASH